MDRLAEIVAQLRAGGARVTPQRVMIIRALLAADHPTVEGIYARIQREAPTTSIATVYRTLLALKEIGAVFEVSAGGPLSHYDGRRPAPHAHLVCTVCGRVADAPAVDLSGLATDLAQRSEHWQVGAEARFYGVCPQCQGVSGTAMREAHSESDE